MLCILFSENRIGRKLLGRSAEVDYIIPLRSAVPATSTLAFSFYFDRRIEKLRLK